MRDDEEVANVRGNVEQRRADDDLGPTIMGTLELRFATPANDYEVEHAVLMTSTPLREAEGRQRERWREAMIMVREIAEKRSRHILLFT